MRPSLTSTISMSSVITVVPVMRECTLARQCTAAFAPSISMERMLCSLSLKLLIMMASRGRNSATPTAFIAMGLAVLLAPAT